MHELEAWIPCLLPPSPPLQCTSPGQDRLEESGNPIFRAVFFQEALALLIQAGFPKEGGVEVRLLHVQSIALGLALRGTERNPGLYPSKK